VKHQYNPRSEAILVVWSHFDESSIQADAEIPAVNFDFNWELTGVRLIGRRQAEGDLHVFWKWVI
jgi:hypothetical protein